MNTSVYLFGKFNSGYSQYPDDYAASIFQKFSANAKSTTQIAIHRDGNLMYYGYIRKLQQEKYIGFCIVLNGLVLKRIDGLFSLFEYTISNLVSKGLLVHFNEQGELVTSVERLYMNQEEIELVTESLRAGFKRFEPYIESLPAVSYGISKDSIKDFVVNDEHEKIIKSSYTNGYTYIYKSEGFNTVQLNSYKNILQKSYQEKKELQTKVELLQEEYKKIQRQKKQVKFVFLLFIILFCCMIGLLFLNDNLHLTRDALSRANDTISMKNDSITVKNIKVSNLQKENEKMDARLRDEINNNALLALELEELQGKISSRQPFIITGTSFNFNSGFLTVRYYGLDESPAPVEIKVKAFSENGESYSNSSTIHLDKGDNSVSIYLSNRLDSRKWHSFEVLKDNVIIGGDRH